MIDDATVLSSSGILKDLLFIGLGVAGTMFVRGIRAEEQDKQTKSDLEAVRVMHAKEVGAINSHFAEFKGLVEKLAGTVAVLDKQVQLVNVTLTGVDGHNGLRSDFRAMAKELRELRERLVRVEAMVRQDNERGNAHDKEST